MSLLVSKFFDEQLEIVNTTADYNIVNYIMKLNKDNLLDNSKFLVWNLKLLNKKLKKNNLVVYLKNKYNFELKNIIFFDLYHRVPIHSYDFLKNINIYVYIIDNHCEMGIDNYRYTEFTKKDKFNLLCCYAYNLGCCNPTGVNFKFNYFFHNVIHKININKNPINKVLICGRGVNNITRYPMRNKMYGLSQYKLNKNRHLLHYFKRDIPYRASREDKRTWGFNFIKKLNDYKVVFCDDGNIKTNVPYILAKFFEIMSAGSVLLTHNKSTKKYFTKLGFIDGKDYLSIDLDNSNDNIMNTIKEILSDKNKENLDKIRLSGYCKVWKYHSSEARFNDLAGILDGTLEYKEFDDGINNTKYLSKKYT